MDSAFRIDLFCRRRLTLALEPRSIDPNGLGGTPAGHRCQISRLRRDASSETAPKVHAGPHNCFAYEPETPGRPNALAPGTVPSQVSATFPAAPSVGPRSARIKVICGINSQNGGYLSRDVSKGGTWPGRFVTTGTTSNALVVQYAPSQGLQRLNTTVGAIRIILQLDPTLYLSRTSLRKATALVSFLRMTGGRLQLLQRGYFRHAPELTN